MALCVVKRWNYLSFVAILNLIFTSYIFSIIKNYFFFLVKQNIKRRLEVFITNLNHISYLCGSFKTNSVVFHNIFWFSSIFPLENFGKFSEEGMSHRGISSIESLSSRPISVIISHPHHPWAHGRSLGISLESSTKTNFEKRCVSRSLVMIFFSKFSL